MGNVDDSPGFAWSCEQYHSLLFPDHAVDSQFATMTCGEWRVESHVRSSEHDQQMYDLATRQTLARKSTLTHILKAKLIGEV